MANATWVREALVGSSIRTGGGINAIISDIGDTGASVQSEAAELPILIPMREIRAVIALWSQLRTFPSDEQIVALGIPAERATYLVPLIQALRRAPNVREWLRGSRSPERPVSE